MLQLRPMDTQVSIFNQLGVELAPVVLINLFAVDAADVSALLKAWEDDATWVKRQPDYIATQLHRGIAAFVQQAGCAQPLHRLIVHSPTPWRPPCSASTSKTPP